MTLAGTMTIRNYNMEVREVGHMTAFDGTEWIIINQSSWYRADEYTDESAIAHWKKERGLC